MNRELYTLIGTIIACLFGSGGIVIWFLNRIAKNFETREKAYTDIEEIKHSMKMIEDGLVMALENDKVIFKALRTHEINGESEEQEAKMDQYFLSLLCDKGVDK